MKKIISICLAALMVLSFASCGGENADETNSTNSAETSAQSGADNSENDEILQSQEFVIGSEESDVFTVKSPYCLLKFPSKWEKYITVEYDKGEVYTLTFKHSITEVALFDISFGENDYPLLGVLVKDGKETSVRINSYEFDPSDKYYSVYCTMQEDVNVLINHLIEEYEIKM